MVTRTYDNGETYGWSGHPQASLPEGSPTTITVGDGVIAIHKPATFHAPRAATTLLAFEPGRYSTELESLLELGAGVQENMVTTANMAMLDTKLVEVAAGLESAGKALCDNIGVATKGGAELLSNDFAEARQAFQKAFEQFKKSLLEGQSDAEAHFVAARTKLLADDAIARTRWGGSLLADMTKLLSLDPEGPLGKLSRDEKAFLLQSVVKPIIQAIEKSNVERISKAPEIGWSLEEVAGTKLRELMLAYPGATYEYTADKAGDLGVNSGDHLLTLPVPGNGPVIIAVEDKLKQSMSPKDVKDESNRAKRNRGANGVILIVGDGVLSRKLGSWWRTAEVDNGFYIVYNTADHALLAATIHMAYLTAVAAMSSADDNASLTHAIERELTSLESVITLCNSVSGQMATITKAVDNTCNRLGNVRDVVTASVARLRTALVAATAA